MRHTEGESTAQPKTQDDEEEGVEELAVLADGGDEWPARCGLPDLMQ